MRLITDDRDKASKQRKSKFTECQAHHSGVPGISQVLSLVCWLAFVDKVRESRRE